MASNAALSICTQILWLNIVTLLCARFSGLLFEYFSSSTCRSSEPKDATDSRDDASDGASDDASEDTGESPVLPNDDIDSLI